MIREVGVVVPARDEEERLGACLLGLHRAAAHPRLARVRVEVVVVLDACADGSAAVVRAAPGPPPRLLHVDLRSAGAARAAGIRAYLARARALPDETWIATTDADTRVPPDWLARQLARADAGVDAVLGTVDVDDWSGHPAEARSRYEARYRRGGTGVGHGHVHAANLGVRASALAAAGGMPELAVGEDHALLRALARSGARVDATDEVRVTTSARRDPRAAGGFGDLLLRLGRPAGGAADDARPPGPVRVATVADG